MCFISFSFIWSDGEADVAIHLPVCGQALQGDDRASGEGRQPLPQLLLLHQDRHGRQGEGLPPATVIRNIYGISYF